MRQLLTLASLLLALPSPVRAQGEFVNFEVPQIAPIAVVEVAQRSFVLACNTPDNSVEIYDAATKGFVTRVGVGQSPVSVRWNAGRFYTCNFLGDSVSVVSLTWVEGQLRARLERSVHVGDEPTDIAFETGTGIAWVALHSRSQVARVDALNLAPAPTTPGQTHLKTLEFSDSVTPSIKTALKAPRELGLLDDGRFLGLNTMGGNTTNYDFDLFVEDSQLTPDTVQAVGGMGSTNTAFGLSVDGDRLLVVGGVAQNHVLGEAQLKVEELGFVRYFLWTLPVPNVGVAWAAPSEQTPDTSQFPTFPLWTSIDLNRDYTSSGMEPIDDVGSHVSQPMDVLAARDNLGAEHVILALFGSDEVMILTPDSSSNGGWARRHVDIPPVAMSGTSTGPRGLAFDAHEGVVWVLNRLDNSLAWFPLLPSGTPSAQRVDLQRDPTPDIVRQGRPFLYSAHLTSGNEIVSCSSCHVDGRTDGLQWNLGDPGNMSAGPAIPPELIDQVPYLTHFSPDKGGLVTQSLQGLVNSQIETRGLQYVTTNAPYHWRGDRATFADFNVAFVDLQGRSQPLDTAEMEAYSAFVDGIHYPPNPEQPLTRVFSGDMGQTPQELDSEDVGTGALYGMKLFHIRSSASGRSCVQCHTLPEGSSNTFVLDAGPKVPLENAAMRGLFQREKALIDDFDVTRGTSWTRISDFGLTRNGVGVTVNGVSKNDERSINDFIAGFSLGSGPLNKPLARRRAVTEFARQFDWGVAPMVGRTMTVSLSDPLDTNLLRDMEQSAEDANSGLAVFVRRNNGTRTQGYWYDCASEPPVFRRVGGVRTLEEAALLALVQTANDLIVFQCTPTGSERRVAHLGGDPNPLSGPDPHGIELLPMVPNTAYEPVTQLDDFVDPHPTPGDPRSQSIEQRLVMEAAVRNATFDFGVADAPRHEPPRRFRVAGHDIRHGAKLRLGLPVGTSGSGQFATLELDLAATAYRHGPENKVIWESTEELDARMTMAFLCGGPELTEVSDLLGGNLSASLDPDADNQYVVEVVNQTGSPGTAPGLQPLLLGDDRD